jgi:hypothetical protein
MMYMATTIIKHGLSILENNCPELNTTAKPWAVKVMD